jgi:hypothetical protein
LNQLLGLAPIPIKRSQLETGSEQPLRNWPAHVTDSDEPELVFFWRDFIHGKFSLRPMANELNRPFFAAPLFGGARTVPFPTAAGVVVKR